MTPTEKTILLIVLIPLFIAMVAFAIHAINVWRHRRRAKQVNDAINRIGR
jgi:heme/copper-type cytochrome/quinol oxidase subunit 2